MLSLVVNDALEGVDIARRYPAFYRLLLADPRLRWAFLEALEIREKEEDGELESLPDPLDVDLAFLEQVHPLQAMVDTADLLDDFGQTITTPLCLTGEPAAP